MPARYGFDDRVHDLMGVIAGALLAGAQDAADGQQACVDALRLLESLRVTAAYTEAGVPADDYPLCDPAGVEAVNSLWHAVQAELGDEGWEQLADDWRRR